MPKEHLNPEELFPSLQYGFSQVVTSQGGKTVYLSGQVAWDKNQEVVGPGDLGAQTRQALRNLETAMRIAGGRLADVVSLRLYIVNYRQAEAGPISAALREFFPVRPPTSTWIGVQALADEAFLIEIEAVAVVE